MRARLVFEKFTEDGDPIKDMGIGINLEMIKDFIETETDYAYVKDDVLWICASYRKIGFIEYLLSKSEYIFSETSIDRAIDFLKYYNLGEKNIYGDIIEMLKKYKFK
jgi:hypothetical protein